MICQVGIAAPTGTGTKDVVIIPFRNFNSMARDFDATLKNTLTHLLLCTVIPVGATGNTAGDAGKIYTQYVGSDQ